MGYDIRFVNAEKWRSQLTFADGKTPIAPDGRVINLDEEIAQWDKDGTLRRNVAPYYPQYYHKTDKVGSVPYDIPSFAIFSSPYSHYLRDRALFFC